MGLTFAFSFFLMSTEYLVICNNISTWYECVCVLFKLFCYFRFLSFWENLSLKIKCYTRYLDSILLDRYYNCPHPKTVKLNEFNWSRFKYLLIVLMLNLVIRFDISWTIFLFHFQTQQNPVYFISVIK